MNRILILLASLLVVGCPQQAYKTESVTLSTLKSHPYGGTCEPMSEYEAISLASQVVSGGVRLNNGASICKHNVQILEEDNEKILKISTGLGDGIDSEWSDIREGNRRRFEFMFTRQVFNKQVFRVEYAVRIPKENVFLPVPENQYYWFYINQLHPGGINAPVMAVSVNRFEGIKVFDNLIQDTTGFGAARTDYIPEAEGRWVKVKIEYKPSRTKGFRRLWVDDVLVLNEIDLTTTFDKGYSKFNFKFGIYQGTDNGIKGFKYPSIRSATRQSVEFKNFRFRIIN